MDHIREADKFFFSTGGLAWEEGGGFHIPILDFKHVLEINPEYHISNTIGGKTKRKRYIRYINSVPVQREREREKRRRTTVFAVAFIHIMYIPYKYLV